VSTEECRNITRFGHDVVSSRAVNPPQSETLPNSTLPVMATAATQYDHLRTCAQAKNIIDGNCFGMKVNGAESGKREAQMVVIYAGHGIHFLLTSFNLLMVFGEQQQGNRTMRR
jgi:hypothetical protein